MYIQHLKSFNAVVSEFEAVHAGPNLPPHALKYQRLKVRLVVNNENPIRFLVQLSPSIVTFSPE